MFPMVLEIFQWEDKNRIEIGLGNKLMFPTNPIYLGLGILMRPVMTTSKKSIMKGQWRY